MYEKIPSELKEKAQWVNVWNSSKVPMQTGQKKAASSVSVSYTHLTLPTIA